MITRYNVVLPCLLELCFLPFPLSLGNLFLLELLLYTLQILENLMDVMGADLGPLTIWRSTLILVHNCLLAPVPLRVSA